jgi:hypothetical protein
MSIFKFNADPNSPVVKPRGPSLLVNLKPTFPVQDVSKAPATPAEDSEVFIQMMREGKLVLPAAWQGLSSSRLMDMGYPKVLWSKKYGVKYVLHRMSLKTYDS